MYELKPVRLSKRALYVKFTDEMEQTQSREFFNAVQTVGKPVRLLVGKGYNHFELLETLANPYGLAGRAALEQMQLMPPIG